LVARARSDTLAAVPLPFGIAVPNYGPLASAENLVRLARRGEELGAESIWVADHLVAPCDVLTNYPYDPRPEPKPGMGVIEEFYEPLVTLAYIAGATPRIRLGVSVFVMPYRNPIVTAKMIATLDAMSGGRVLFGVGVGWLREEFAALALDPALRGPMTDEYLEVCRRLWRDEISAFEGKHYRLPPVRTRPKPVQTPWPPIWVGGNSEAAIDRAARLGDGWHAIDLSPEEIAPRITLLRDRMQQAGRGPAGFTVSVRKTVLSDPPDKVRRDRDAYASAGVGYLVANLHATSIDDLERALGATAEVLAL
jgi:probable F420-dependent oxidoreductase